MPETWKPIPGMPYEASSCGRIRSRARVVTHMHAGRLVRTARPGKVLSMSYMTFNGQPSYVTVKCNGRTEYVHRLVAMAWHAASFRPDSEVNHINGNRRDNRPENLEWVTHRENIRHSYREFGSQRRPATPGTGRRMKNGPRSKQG